MSVAQFACSSASATANEPTAKPVASPAASVATSANESSKSSSVASLKEPFRIVARAPGVYTFDVHPVSNEAALLRISRDGRTRQLARIEGKQIRLVFELLKDFPAIPDGATVRMAGGDTYWLASNGTARGETCALFQFKAAGWSSIAKTTEDQGACDGLAAWTQGNAVALLRGKKGFSLLALGDNAPAAMPKIPPSPACDIMPVSLAAWSSGELRLFGPDCKANTYLIAFEPNEKRATLWETPIDGNAPTEAYFPSKNAAILFGGGVLPADPNTEVSTRVDVDFDGKKFLQRSWVAAPSPREPFLIPGAMESLVADDDEFSFVSGEVVGGDRMLLVGTLESTKETVLLSNQPVDGLLTFTE